MWDPTKAGIHTQMEEKGEKVGEAASELTATFTEFNLTKKHAAKNTEININT